MEQQAEQRQNGKGDRGTLYVGMLTAGGVVAYVMQCADIAPVYKLAFVALVSVAGFAAFIVRYILQMFEWHIRRHDALSSQAHAEISRTLAETSRMQAEQCGALSEIRDSLKSMNGHSRTEGR